jgi:hypothetical protein
MKHLGLLGALALIGCTQQQLVEPVTVVATRTPGVSFVVVRPNINQGHEKTTRVQPGDNAAVNGSSWYVLLCDARPADGMHCFVPTEAALSRYSYTPTSGIAAAPIDQGVGTLSDFSAHLSRDRDKDENEPAPPAAPTPPPPVVPPAASTPPPAAAGKAVKP